MTSNTGTLSIGRVFFLANEPEIVYSTVEKLYNKRYGRWGNVFFV